MILLETKNIFSDRLAVLSVVDEYINLDFDTSYSKGRSHTYNEGDGISREYFSDKEITALKNKFKIKKLPFEIYDKDLLDDIYDFVRK